MPDGLSQAVSTATVAGLASARSYERGLAYFEAGRVGPLRASTRRAGATVQGSEAYSVELRAEGEELRFSCSCPVGLEGAFCKHCVAVARTWLGEHGGCVLGVAAEVRARDRARSGNGSADRHRPCRMGG